MTVMNSDVYDAFLAAGVPDDKARKAAESVAAFESHSALNRFARIEGDLAILKWMVGTVLVIVLLLAGQLLRLTHAG